MNHELPYIFQDLRIKRCKKSRQSRIVAVVVIDRHAILELELPPDLNAHILEHEDRVELLTHNGYINCVKNWITLAEVWTQFHGISPENNK